MSYVLQVLQVLISILKYNLYMCVTCLHDSWYKFKCRIIESKGKFTRFTTLLSQFVSPASLTLFISLNSVQLANYFVMAEGQSTIKLFRPEHCNLKGSQFEELMNNN